jgi:hypothetical protein
MSTGQIPFGEQLQGMVAYRTDQGIVIAEGTFDFCKDTLGYKKKYGKKFVHLCTYDKIVQITQITKIKENSSTKKQGEKK